MVTAVVICMIGVFARADFQVPRGLNEARAPYAFWILLLAVWAALNTVFVASDSDREVADDPGYSGRPEARIASIRGVASTGTQPIAEH